MEEARYIELLRRKAEQIKAKGPEIEGMPPPGKKPGAEPGFEAVSEAASLEAVIRWYRPVLVITDDRFVRSDANPKGGARFNDPNEGASRDLLDALEKNRPHLDPAIRSIGRVELEHNAQFPWVGTGWIVDSDLGSDIIVTNAHVAREFAMRSGTGFTFRPGVPDFSIRQFAHIDFREEIGRETPREFPIRDVIWISEEPGVDMALMRVERTAGNDRLDPPLKLKGYEPSENTMLAVIGFPGSNNGYDPEPFQRLFGAALGKKRLSPGFYTGRRSGSLTYDCSTLPGSSGSVVLDVTTGQVVGLHFAGTAFDTNYALSAADMARVIRDRPWQSKSSSIRARQSLDSRVPQGATPSVQSADTVDADRAVRLVVPLEITIRLGNSQEKYNGQ